MTERQPINTEIKNINKGKLLMANLLIKKAQETIN